ncbi:MAG: hypothetical protein IK065_06795 [Neisseriaceae bacterium]|nr:hypothetical protein [Neisseriaceae bacterium]
MYFNNFLFRHIVRLVGKNAHPTAFLFQKLGFAGVSIKLKFQRKLNGRLGNAEYGATLLSPCS